MQDKKFDIAYIRRYVQGELSPKEMHELERAAEADEMLMDIILGVETEHLQQLPRAHEEIKRDITTRVSSTAAKTRVLPWRSLSIAASLLAVLGVSTYLFVWSPQPRQAQQVAEENVDRSVDQKTESIPSIGDDGMNTSPEQELETPPRRIASSSNKPNPNLAPAAPKEPQDKMNLRDELMLDSNAIVLAQAPSKPLEAVEITAPQAYRKQSVSGQAQPIRIRGTSSSLASSHAAQAIVSGKVLDAETEKPMPHVMIKDLISNKTTSADSLGRFLLLSDSSQVNLALNYVGYESKQLLTGTSELEIKLQPKNNSLDELVVTGSDSNSPYPRKLKPIGGWRNFRNYIKKAVKPTGLSAGIVVLRFDLDSQGSPVNIQVEQSLSATHDKKAIQLLKDGPKWEKALESQSAKVKIEF